MYIQKYKSSTTTKIMYVSRHDIKCSSRGRDHNRRRVSPIVIAVIVTTIAGVTASIGYHDHGYRSGSGHTPAISFIYIYVHMEI